MTKVQTLISKLTILAMIASLFAVVQPARAAGLTDMSDTMSNQTIGELSDHTILFTTPTGVAASSTVIVTFETDYDIEAGLTFADLDFSFQATPDGVCDTGDTEITLAAAPAGPTMGAVRTSGLVLTFTNGSTAVPAGAEVCIEIGTVAEEAGPGVEQVENPSALGSYTVSFSGTFADTGTLATPIQDSDQVSITASVDPSITFDLDTAVADTDSDAPYSVALGTITTTDTRVSGATDGINSIYMDLDTNASGGAVVTVASLNGASGLVSTSVGTDTIPNTEPTIGDGTAAYGICVEDGSALVGDFDPVGVFAGQTCAQDSETNDTANLTAATPTPIFNTAGAPVSEARGVVNVGASISGTTPAHSDYTDTLTFIATGTF